MICAYLLHINHFKESKDALKYYGNARTRNAKGVTIPSQRRYVLYYNHLLRHGLQYTRTMVLLKGFEMAPIPSFQNSTCSKHCVAILNTNRNYVTHPLPPSPPPPQVNINVVCGLVFWGFKIFQISFIFISHCLRFITIT